MWRTKDGGEVFLTEGSHIPDSNCFVEGGRKRKRSTQGLLGNEREMLLTLSQKKDVKLEGING